LDLNSNHSAILLHFRDIRAFVRQKPLFPYPTPYSSQNFKIWLCSPWSKSAMLGSAKNEYPKLTNREIIFEEFQPMWSGYLNVTERRTDRQTDDLP